jgi:hypothetical protein
VSSSALARARRPYTSYFKERGTDDRLEKAIVRSLIPPHCFSPFKSYCDLFKDVIGTEASDCLRARNRRYRLSLLREKDYIQFKKHSESFGLHCPETLEECVGAIDGSTNSSNQVGIPEIDESDKESKASESNETDNESNGSDETDETDDTSIPERSSYTSTKMSSKSTNQAAANAKGKLN